MFQYPSHSSIRVKSRKSLDDFTDLLDQCCATICYVLPLTDTTISAGVYCSVLFIEVGFCFDRETKDANMFG